MSIPATKHHFEKLSQRYLLWLTLLTVVGGWVVALPLRFFLPLYYPTVFPYIMVYFYLWGLGYRWLLNRPEGDAKSSTQLFMAFKVAKFVASVAVVAAYLTLGDPDKQAHPFVLNFMFFYMVYLIFETRFFFLYEKCRKEQKQGK